MIIIDLIYNLSLLVALSILSGILDDRFDRSQLTGQLLQGLMFGGIAVIGMMHPYVYSEGIIFDGRSVVISLGTLFFGPLAGGITALIAGIYRYNMGGAGLEVGMLTILSSYIIGWVFHILYSQNHPEYISKIRLYIFGVLVHLMLIYLMFTLPLEHVWDVIKTIGFTILIVFPAVTVLIGKIFQDQIERKRQFRLLSESENKFRLLVNSTDDLIFTVDRDNRYTAIFGKWFEKDGLSKEHYLGKKASDILGEEVGALHEKKNSEALTGKTVVYEWELGPQIKKHIPDIIDEKIYYQSKLSPIRDESDRVVGLVGIARNITELKKAQVKITQSLKEKNVLLGEIHHRVKNNMAIISSLLTLQSEYARDSQTKALFLDNETRVRSMALVHEIVYERTNFSEINMRDLLHRLGHLITQSYNLKNRNIILDIDSDEITLGIKKSIPCTLLVNELISNAYKHAFNGKEKNDEKNSGNIGSSGAKDSSLRGDGGGSGGSYETIENGEIIESEGNSGNRDAIENGENRGNRGNGDIVTNGGTITVRFRQFNGKIKLSVTDDGRGVDDPADLEVPSSFGYTIVHGLVQQLQGDIRFESPEKGLRVVVTF